MFLSTRAYWCLIWLLVNIEFACVLFPKSIYLLSVDDLIFIFVFYFVSIFFIINPVISFFMYTNKWPLSYSFSFEIYRCFIHCFFTCLIFFVYSWILGLGYFIRCNISSVIHSFPLEVLVVAYALVSLFMFIFVWLASGSSSLLLLCLAFAVILFFDSYSCCWLA